MRNEAEYEEMRAERDVALRENEELNEECARLASQLAGQVAANQQLWDALKKLCQTPDYSEGPCHCLACDPVNGVDARN